MDLDERGVVDTCGTPTMSPADMTYNGVVHSDNNYVEQKVSETATLSVKKYNGDR